MPTPIESLVAQLASPDVRQRSQAVLQLQPGTANDSHAIAELVRVLCTDDDLNVREDATWTLARHGKNAVAALLHEINHPDSQVRHHLVHALGKIGDVQAVSALILATQDTDPAVRLKSVYALGQIGEAQAIDALITSLNDPIQNVSWTAREALESLGKPALPHLIQALTQESTQVRELAANLLGDLADESAVDPLIAALETDAWHVRFAIVEALGNIGDVRALPIIEQMKNDPHPPVRAIATAVSKTLSGRKN